jgi:hypothetical protein
MRIELVDEAVGVARPGDELVLHLDPGLLGKILAELDERVGRVPRRPAKRQRFFLSFGGARPRNSKKARCERNRK